MKRTKLILGSLAITAILGGLYLNSSVETISERSYFSEGLNENGKDNSRAGANEYLNSLYMNPVTGKVEPADYQAAYEQAMNRNNAKAASFTFTEDGPDNVGGRTRAIIVDVDRDWIVYAGSVDGGMYKTNDAGNNWSRLDGWDDRGLSVGDPSSMSISSICMTTDGTLYVGTGGKSLLGEYDVSTENSGMQDGDGIWYSIDEGATFQQLAGTNDMEISRVAADLSKNDVFYFTGGSQGLHRVTNKGALESMSANGVLSSISTVSLSVSGDGNVIICTGGTKVYVSENGGTSFVDVVGLGSSVPTPIASGGARKECAVSYEKNAFGKYNLFMAEEQANVIRGIWYSEDHGQNWYQIAPASTNGWTPCISANGQCYYDMVIDAVPGHPDHCIFGGIDVYRLQKTPGTAASAADWSRERISQWNYPTSSPKYIHADNHRFTWDSQGALYVGNDGGMSKSFNNSTQFFTTINKGYNATQFYGIGYGPNGELIGGSQDNGTQYNDHTSLSGRSYADVNGGDGFECEVSFLGDGDAILSTIYGGSLSRSNDRGTNWQTVDAPGAGAGFYNAIRLFEDDNDLDTKDSIEFITDTNMVVGDTVIYYSETFSLPLSHILTQNLVVNYDSLFVTGGDSILPNFDTIPDSTWYYYNPIPQDTIMLPDTKQSLFVTRGDVVYLTRSMMRFGHGMVNNSANDYPWWDLGTSGVPQSYEFSKDGNVLWIGTTGGALIRVSGLDSAYSSTAADVMYRPETGDTIINIATGDTTFGGFAALNYSAANYRYGHYNDSSMVTYKLWTTSVVNSGNIITDISTSALDMDRVIFSTGTSSGTVKLIDDATAVSPGTPQDIGGTGASKLPSYPVFGCEFIMNPAGSDIIMVGTEFGAYSTDNPTATASTITWTSHTAETGTIPVFDVRQQWRDFDQGAKNPYHVYLGTHARGIWKSGSYVSTTEHQEIIEDVKDISGIRIFPNPLSTEGNIAFELGNRTNVEFKVYDLQGKIINQVVWSKMESGKHTMNFSVEHLPAGTYLVTLKAGTSTEVTKFIKY